MKKREKGADRAEAGGFSLDGAITARLLSWYQANARVLPWRENREPYRVWLSEIMLQQTRVEAVIPYYHRFLTALPDLGALATVEEGRLLKLWEGLGYYSRARNLKKAAQVVVAEHGGVFPCDYAEILKLPGIGVYTAGAVASICFEAPVPAVDGNVLRLVSRLTAFGGDVGTPAVRAQVTEALRRIYPAKNRGDFTQSLMELGAMICLPNGAPKCEICPIFSECRAAKEGRAADFPLRPKKKARRKQRITVLILRCGQKTAIRQRKNSGLLAGLWEFPNVPEVLSSDEALALADSLGAAPIAVTATGRHKHIFTHIEWEMTGYFIDCARQAPGLTWADTAATADVYALPAAFQPFLPT